MGDTEPCPRWFWEEDDKTWHAYNPGDSDILETIYRTGGTSVELDGKYKVNITARTQTRSDIPNGSVRNVIRATWFWEDAMGKWQPHPEDTAEKLEVAYFTRFYGEKIRDLGLGSLYAILEGPNGLGKQYLNDSPSCHPQNIRRGYEGRSIPSMTIDAHETAQASRDRKSKDSNYIDFGFDQAPVHPDSLVGSDKGKSSSPATTRKKPVHGIWKEGFVGKRSGGMKEKKNIWKNRYLIVTTDSVGIYINRTKEKEKIPLMKIARVESFHDYRCESGFHHFVIKTFASQEFYFRCATLSEANEWIDIINDAMKPPPKEEEDVTGSTGIADVTIHSAPTSVTNTGAPTVGTPTGTRLATHSTPGSGVHTPIAGGGGGGGTGSAAGYHPSNSASAPPGGFAPGGPVGNQGVGYNHQASQGSGYNLQSGPQAGYNPQVGVPQGGYHPQGGPSNPGGYNPQGGQGNQGGGGYNPQGGYNPTQTPPSGFPPSGYPPGWNPPPLNTGSNPSGGFGGMNPSGGYGGGMNPPGGYGGGMNPPINTAPQNFPPAYNTTPYMNPPGGFNTGYAPPQATYNPTYPAPGFQPTYTPGYPPMY